MDFIESSILNAQNDGADPDTKWTVLFKHGDTQMGKITALYPGYRLERINERTIYFSENSVIYLMPQV